MPGGERDPVPKVRRRCRTAEKGAAGTDGGLRPARAHRSRLRRRSPSTRGQNSSTGHAGRRRRMRLAATTSPSTDTNRPGKTTQRSAQPTLTPLFDGSRNRATPALTTTRDQFEWDNTPANLSQSSDQPLISIPQIKSTENRHQHDPCRRERRPVVLQQAPLSLLKNAPMSPTSRSGTSMAAKWPPRSNSDQCTMSFPRSAMRRTEGFR